MPAVSSEEEIIEESDPESADQSEEDLFETGSEIQTSSDEDNPDIYPDWTVNTNDTPHERFLHPVSMGPTFEKKKTPVEYFMDFFFLSGYFLPLPVTLTIR